MVTCSLDAFEEEERKENKKGKSRGVTTSYNIQQKGYRKVKDRDDEILGFDFVFGGYNNIDFNFISCYYWLFSESQFAGI